MSHGAERKATWLELFFDLVYVVAVAELAATLAADVSMRGVLAFAALFVPVWWSWTGLTFYADRFDRDDAWHRVATLVAMLAVVGLAVSAHHAFGSSSRAFALSYVLVRVVLVALYLRVPKRVPAARPLARRYALGFSIGAAIWAASALAPEPARYWMWLAALAIEFATPLSARALQAKLPLSTSHLPERFGLFTIIVLGESVASVVHGAAETGLGLSQTVSGLLGLALAFGIWWIYFSNLDESVVKRTRVAGQVWVYGHLPLVMAITAAAVGVKHVVALHAGEHLHDADRWLLGGTVALAFASLGLLLLTTARHEGRLHNETRATMRFAAAVLAIALAAFGAALDATLLVGLLAALAVAQVVVEEIAKRQDQAQNASKAA